VHLAKSGTNDADQRISQDVEKLSGDLSGLVTGMVKPFVDILWWVSKKRHCLSVTLLELSTIAMQSQDFLW
jgi:ABC-type uncharacterized transport system fused permease/ATPase subunit